MNNQNLAPDFSSIGEPYGTGERISGNIYYTNNTPKQILIFAHGNTPSTILQINTKINGIYVKNTSTRVTTSPDSEYVSQTFIVPKNSNYSVEVSNYHHYEWREYPILIGRNGSNPVTIINNITNKYGPITNNTYINNTYINATNNFTDADLFDNFSKKVNKTGDLMSGELDIGAQIFVYSPTYPVMRLVRNTTATSTLVATFVNSLNTSAVIRDGLGVCTGFEFNGVVAPVVVNQVAGFICGVREGSNDSFAQTFRVVRNNSQNEVGRFNTFGQFIITNNSRGISIKEGANAKQGVATLSGGYVNISNTAVTTNSRIFLTPQNCNNCGTPYLYAKQAGVNFSIGSTNTLDGSIVAYEIFEPS